MSAWSNLNHLKKRALWIIIAVEIVVAGVDAALLLRCHYLGEECWPWFFTFCINLPSSLVNGWVVGWLTEHWWFWPALVFTFVSFVAVGTLQWFVVATMIVADVETRSDSNHDGQGSIDERDPPRN